MPEKILVVAAHSDDEALGCAGTIAKHVKNGDSVEVIFLTNGVSSRLTSSDSSAKLRESAMEKAAEKLGIATITLFDFPDNALDSQPLLEVTRLIEGQVSESGVPDIVYTHFPHDLNIDHRIAYQATMTCFRPQPNSLKRPKKILSFEVMSSTGWIHNSGVTPFNPSYFVDITDTLDIKIEALREYCDEMKPWPHARSYEAIEALAKYRGSMIGIDAAEAFCIERIIE